MHDDVGLVGPESFGQVGSECAFVGELPQRRGQIAIARRRAGRALNLDSRMRVSERTSDERGLQARERTGAAQQSYAHRSCQPEGFRIARVANARAQPAISTRAAST